MNELEKAQANLARSGYRLLFAGAAFVAFGAMATRALLGTLEGSIRGERVLNDFNTAVNRLKKAVGESIVDNFGDTLEGWINSLDELANNDFLTGLLGGAAFELAITITGIGFTLIGLGIAQQFIAWLIGAFVPMGLLTQEAATTATASAGLAGGFVLQLAVASIITIKVAEILWDLTPEAFKNQGELLAGLALEQAIGSGKPVMFGQQDIAFPPGTSQRDFGPFDTTRLDMGGGNSNSVTMYIDNLFTQADEDTMIDLIRRVLVEETADSIGIEGGIEQ